MLKPKAGIAAVVVFALFGMTASVAQDSLMTPNEIKAAWVDKKVFSRSPTGGLFDFFLFSNGSAEVAGSSWHDSGTWRLSDNGYCTTWKKIRAGVERCFTVVKKGSTVVVFNPDNSVAAEVLKIVE